MIQLKSINKFFKNDQLPMELVKSDGYFYFVYDCGDVYETHSVYVNNLNQLSKNKWIEEGKEFFDKVKNSF